MRVVKCRQLFGSASRDACNAAAKLDTLQEGPESDNLHPVSDIAP